MRGQKYHSSRTIAGSLARAGWWARIGTHRSIRTILDTIRYAMHHAIDALLQAENAMIATCTAMHAWLVARIRRTCQHIRASPPTCCLLGAEQQPQLIRRVVGAPRPRAVKYYVQAPGGLLF
eukprot:SAG31_NODE_5868_length_2282_cov_6.325240_3_plen_122_part_00